MTKAEGVSEGGQQEEDVADMYTLGLKTQLFELHSIQKLDPDLGGMEADSGKSINKAMNKLGPEGLRASQVSKIVGDKVRRSSEELARKSMTADELIFNATGVMPDHSDDDRVKQKRPSAIKAMEQQGVAYAEEKKDKVAAGGEKATTCCAVQ